MRTMHEERFMSESNPELMGALYRGYKSTEYKRLLQSTNQQEQIKNHVLAYSRIFTACNTILPNLHYQCPRVLAIPENGTDPESAATMTARINQFNRVSKQKAENQRAVINSYFLGISWKKMGFNPGNSPTPRMNPEHLISGSKIANTLPPGPFNTFESPVNVFIDDKGSFRQFKSICHRVPRSLSDLYEFGGYEPEQMEKLLKNYEKKFGSKYDDRDVMFNLNELMIEGRDGVYVLSYADEFDEPLAFNQLEVNSVADVWKPLVFTNDPDSMYPTAHMGVASRVQVWIDEISSKYIENLGRSRAGYYINQNLLAPGQTKESFLKNMIGGAFWGTRQATQGDIMELKSSPIQGDYMNALGLLAQNVDQILGSDSQRISGMSENDTATQDKIAAAGTEIREAGMLDRVRDWLNDQTYTLGDIIQRYDNSVSELNVNPEDFYDEDIRRNQVPTQLEFGTDSQPFPLSYLLESSRFKYEINVYEAVKPDKKALAAEYDDLLVLYASPVVQQALIQSGVRPRLDLVAMERANQFEYINGKRFLEKLDPLQQAAAQTQMMLQTAGGGQAINPATPGSRPKESNSPSSGPSDR